MDEHKVGVMFCNDIHKEFWEHRNEPVLVGFDLARIIGYAEDVADCYMIVQTPRRGIYWHTAVGGYVYLNSLPQEDLARLGNMLALNGCPRVDVFLTESKV